VYNQGITAKTIHKKKLNIRSTVSQQNVKTEKDKECVESMKKPLATQNNGKDESSKTEKNKECIMSARKKNGVDEEFNRTNPQVNHQFSVGTETVSSKRITDDEFSQANPVKKIKLKKTSSTEKSSMECDSVLPCYVLVPFRPLSKDIIVNQPTENLLFSTRPVLGDGNCLYHALLNSKVFVKLYPRFGRDTNKLRKELSQCLKSPKNYTFSEKLFANCPGQRVKDRQDAKMGIEEWSMWLRMDKEWGSQSECILFTKRFGINVVILQQVENGIPTFGTYYRHRKWFELDDKRLKGNLYNKRLHVDRTIFVWLHRLDTPKKVLQSHVEANHFTILEPCLDDGSIDRSKMYIFQDFVGKTEILENPIVLSIPDMDTSESEATAEEGQLENLVIGEMDVSCGETIKNKSNTHSGEQPTISYPIFNPVPNGIHMEYSLPPSHFCDEFMFILRDLPDKIACKRSHDELYEILQKEETKTQSIQDISLVYIDSCKFEFFLSNDSGSIRLFDELIMTPYLTQWSDHDFTEIKTTNDFYRKLMSYIELYFPGKNIHAVSFLLHFPGASAARQWSHVDGTREMWQGSIMCGDWHASTLEFSVLEPRVSNADTLKRVWPTQPENCDIFSKMEANSTCRHLLESYGHILNHESSMPLNSLAIQAKRAPKGYESNYLTGTVLRMTGDTIHAGPPSCGTRCRVVIFFAASEVDGPKYDRHVQWNELTLTVMLLEELWSQLNHDERVYLLNMVHHINSDPNKGPSDCCAFLPNMTIRLYAFLSRRHNNFGENNDKFQEFLRKIACQPNLHERKQLITKGMIRMLDDDLMEQIQYMEKVNGISSREFFLL
jgi:hypothetical protein